MAGSGATSPPTTDRPAAEPGEQRVTPLELFFDLVFVFAITQVSAFVSADPTWGRLLQGLAILAALWWAWVAYAWLGNTAAADDGPIRVVLFAAMGAMLIASIAVPDAFGEDALLFGLAYLVVRVLHLVAYTIVSAGNPELRGAVGRLASTILPAALLLVLAGVLEGTARDLCWIAALTVDYGGLAVRGVRGWHVEPGHFAERHGLIIIIALGESIVSVGVGADHVGLGSGVVTGALLGGAVAAAMWWAYFDVVAIVAERVLRSADPVRQTLIARDSYSYLHLPMVAGIVVFAIGVKRTLEHVSASLDIVPATALCGGVAAFLVALSVFRRRNVGTWNRPRLVASAVLVVLIAPLTAIPALAGLALVAAVSCGLIAYESTRYAAARDRIRHGA